mmetsp:Transcript_13304/g.31401  ORF Transcript_13304/g.31401 Transcript_13304/m.31401 type:complete len:258 (+) Transcript_13304:114-887(+)
MGWCVLTSLEDSDALHHLSEGERERPPLLGVVMMSIRAHRFDLRWRMSGLLIVTPWGSVVGLDDVGAVLMQLPAANVLHRTKLAAVGDLFVLQPEDIPLSATNKLDAGEQEDEKVMSQTNAEKGRGDGEHPSHAHGGVANHSENVQPSGQQTGAMCEKAQLELLKVESEEAPIHEHVPRKGVGSGDNGEGDPCGSEVAHSQHHNQDRRRVLAGVCEMRVFLSRVAIATETLEEANGVGDKTRHKVDHTLVIRIAHIL